MYEPTIKEDFSSEPELTQLEKEALQITLDDKLKEYSTIIQCDVCVRQGDSKILRNEANLPQPGHIGSRYERRRILFIAQNPGYTKPQRTLQHQQYAEAEKTFQNNPTPEHLKRVENTLADAMPHWTIYKQIFSSLLAACGLTLADIAFFNAVRCPTLSNQLPSVAMVENCQSHLEHWLDWLQPKVVVCIGKMAYQEVTPVLTARHISHAYINRDRRLSESERMRNIEEVGQFVRSIALGGKSLPNNEFVAPTSAGPSEKIEATDQRLTPEEEMAVEKIKSEELQDIYVDLIDFSKKLAGVAARQIKTGSKLSFRYFDAHNRYPFAFIVNKYDLLFYIRGLALRNLPSIEEELEQRKIPFKFNPSGDLQVRILEEDTATFVKKMLVDYYSY